MDPLAQFPAETELHVPLSSPAVRTVSALADFQPEQPQVEMPQPGDRSPVVPELTETADKFVSASPRPRVGFWAILRSLPFSVWLVTCLAVLAPPLATGILLRTSTPSATEHAARDVVPVADRAQTGVSIQSTSAGIELSIDGRPVRRTPLIRWKLPFVSQVLGIDRIGYEPWSVAIHVMSDETVEVATTLQPSAQD